MLKHVLKGAAVALLVASPAWAADHGDGPAATSNPDADITDLFAWTDASGKLNLALGWFPDAPAEAKLSDAVLFAFHIGSKASFDATDEVTTEIVCGFDSSEKLSCWAGDSEYVTGDASAEAGITSKSGKLRAFAGDRNDPFFFNISGFQATVAIVKGAAGDLEFDPAGCPAVDEATSQALVEQLSKSGDGSDAKDDFAGKNVQFIVLQVDPSIVANGGPILGVWASTHQRQ
jgi:hypothetical protein